MCATGQIDSVDSGVDEHGEAAQCLLCRVKSAGHGVGGETQGFQNAQGFIVCFSAHEEDIWGWAGGICWSIGAMPRYAMYPWAGQSMPPDKAPDFGGELVEEWKL